MKNNGPLYDNLVALNPIQFSGILLTIAATSFHPIMAFSFCAFWIVVNLRSEKDRARDFGPDLEEEQQEMQKKEQ